MGSWLASQTIVETPSESRPGRLDQGFRGSRNLNPKRFGLKGLARLQMQLGLVVDLLKCTWRLWQGFE